jgi:hypothetical protein
MRAQFVRLVNARSENFGDVVRSKSWRRAMKSLPRDLKSSAKSWTEHFLYVRNDTRKKCMEWWRNEVNKGSVSVRKKVLRDKRTARSYKWKENSKAAVLSMMRPSKANSMESAINPETEELVTEPDELAELMATTLEKLIGKEKERPAERPAWFKEVKRKNRRLEGKWGGILRETNREEVHMQGAL